MKIRLPSRLIVYWYGTSWFFNLLIGKSSNSMGHGIHCKLFAESRAQSCHSFLGREQLQGLRGLTLSLSLSLPLSPSLCFFLFRAERCSSKLSVRNSSSVDQWWREWEVLKSWDTKHHKHMYTHIIFHGGTHGIDGTISSDAKSSSGNPKFTAYGSQKNHPDLFSRGSVEQVESIWFWSFLIFQS